MSNNRITADCEFLGNWQLSLPLVRAVGDLLTGLTIHRARVKHIDSYSSFIMSTCRHGCNLKYHKLSVVNPIND